MQQIQISKNEFEYYNEKKSIEELHKYQSLIKGTYDQKNKIFLFEDIIRKTLLDKPLNEIEIKLIVLSINLIRGRLESIEKNVKNILNAGASKEEILDVLSFMIKSGPSIQSIITLLRTLYNEEFNDK